MDPKELLVVSAGTSKYRSFILLGFSYAVAKNRSNENKLSSLRASDLGLRPKDVASGLVRSVLLGSYRTSKR